MTKEPRYVTFHNYIKSAKTSELLEMMGFKNGKDFFVLDPNEKFLSSDDVTLLEQKEACRKVCEKIKREKITIKKLSDLQKLDSAERYYYQMRNKLLNDEVTPRSMGDTIAFAADWAHRYTNPYASYGNRIVDSNNGIDAIICFRGDGNPEMVISKNEEIYYTLLDSRLGPAVTRGSFHVPMSNGEAFFDPDRQKAWLEHKRASTYIINERPNAKKAQRYMHLFPSVHHLTAWQIESKFHDRQIDRRIKKLQDNFDAKMKRQALWMQKNLQRG